MENYYSYKDKLTGDYLSCFDRIETYAMTTGMDEKTSNDMLMELLDTLYEAQRKGKPVEKIIGTDVERFCKDYFSGQNAFVNWVKDIPALVYRFSIIVVIFTLIDLFFPEQPYASVWEATTDLNYILIGAIAGILSSAVLVMIARTLLFRWKKFSGNMYLVLVIVVFVGSVIIAVRLGTHAVISVSMAGALIVCGAYVILYKALQWYDRYQKYGSIKKPQEEKELGFLAAFKTGWQQGLKEIDEGDTILETLVKRYDRKNKLCRKMGREEISEAAFTEKIRKENRWMKYENIYFIVLFSVCVIVPVAAEIGKSKWYDVLILFVILAVAEGLLCKIFASAANAGYKERVELIELCDAEGITLIALGRKRKAEKEALEEAEEEIEPEVEEKANSEAGQETEGAVETPIKEKMDHIAEPETGDEKEPEEQA